MEAGDAHTQLAAYAEHAEVRIVDPDNPPRSPQILRGQPAIGAWIEAELFQRSVDRVVDLVDGEDRVAFTELHRYRDGTQEMATSTAELNNGLISWQHTILVWDRWE